MIKYLLILLLLISSGAIGQTQPSGVPTNFNVNWLRWGDVQADSIFILPDRDTGAYSPRFPNNLTGRRVGGDSSVWYHTGQRWKKLLTEGDISATVWGSITGTLSNQTDLQNALNLKFNISDTTNKWVQNVYVRSDSLFMQKDGVESFLPNGKNISNASLTASGNYSQNWSENQWYVDSIAGQFLFRMGGIGSTGTRRKEFRINWGGSSFGDQMDGYNMFAVIKKADNITDSLRMGLSSSGTGVLSMGSYDVANSANNTFISYGQITGLINITARDSIWIKGATPAATADSILGVIARGANGISKIVKIPIPTGGGGSATLNNIGAGHRWAATPSGNVKTFFTDITGTIDSASNANALTYKVDTGYMATRYALTLLNLQQVTNYGASTSNVMSYTSLPYFLVEDSARIPNKKYVDTRQESYLGTIYRANTWADLSSFTQTGGIGAAVNSNKIDISGGAGTFTQTLDVNWYSMLERWKVTVRFKVTSAPSGTTYGIGIGSHSTNGFGQVNALGRIDLSNGGAAGKVILNGHNDNQQMAISATGIPFSLNDTIELRVERKIDSIRVTAINRSQADASVTAAFAYELVSGNPQLPNTGRFSVFAFGGTQTIDSISVTSEEIKNATDLVIGDSKTQGYFAQLFSNRYVTKTNDRIKTSVLHAGGYDGTTEWLTYLPEIKALAPKQVLLTNPSNDARSGIPSGTSQAQYNTIVDSLMSWGVDVFHALAFYETAQDNSAWNTFIESTYPSNRIIDTWNPTKNCTGCLAGDGIHLTAKGNDTIYASIINPYALYGASQSGAGFSGTPNYFTKFTSSSNIGNASMSEDATRVTATLMFEQSNTNPDYVWNDTDAGTNEKIWTTETNTGVMNWRTVNDARSAADVFLQFQRTGNAVTLVRHFKTSRFEGGIQFYFPPIGSDDDSDVVRNSASGALGIVAPRATRQALADTSALLRTLIGGGATTIYNGNSALSADRNVSSEGFTLRFDGANNSDTLVSITNTGTSSTGLYSIGSLFGVDAQSTNVGLRAFGTVQGLLSTGDNSYGATIKSNSVAGLLIQSVPASTNTLQEVARFERGSSGGAGANGIGGFITFYNKRTDNASDLSHSFTSLFTNAVAANLTSQLVIAGKNNGSDNTLATFDGNGNVTFGATNSIVGTATNNNAVAGNIGEYVESNVTSGSAVSLTTATSANVTSISLTAGDWDVDGIINYSMTGATTANFSSGSNSTSATLGGDNTFVYTPFSSAGFSDQLGEVVPKRRFSLSGTTTIYLVGNATFSVGSASAYGLIRARRVR